MGIDCPSVASAVLRCKARGCQGQCVTGWVHIASLFESCIQQLLRNLTFADQIIARIGCVGQSSCAAYRLEQHSDDDAKYAKRDQYFYQRETSSCFHGFTGQTTSSVTRDNVRVVFVESTATTTTRFIGDTQVVVALSAPHGVVNAADGVAVATAAAVNSC